MDSAPTPEVVMNRYQQAKEMRALLGLLQIRSKRQAQAMRMVYLDGLTQREAARVLRISEPAVSQLIKSGLKYLQSRRQ